MNHANHYGVLPPCSAFTISIHSRLILEFIWAGLRSQISRHEVEFWTTCLLKTQLYKNQNNKFNKDDMQFYLTFFSICDLMCNGDGYAKNKHLSHHDLTTNPHAAAPHLYIEKLGFTRVYIFSSPEPKAHR